jgi:thymidylate kinase
LNPTTSAAPSSSQALLVSFSGIDGAGKSTQIANLCAFLGAVGLRVQIITFWDDVVVLRSLRESAGHRVFRGDRGIGSPEAPIRRRDKNVRSPVMTFVRLGLYWLDALSFARTIRRARGSGVDIVIFDRCLCDELANLDLRSHLTRACVRAVMRIAPPPDLSLLLDADPDQAHRRKPEYPLEFVRANRMAYIRLSEFLGGITVIPPLPLEQAKNAVIRQVLGRFFSRSPEISPADSAASPAVPVAQKQVDGRSARPVAS